VLLSRLRPILRNRIEKAQCNSSWAVQGAPDTILDYRAQVAKSRAAVRDWLEPGFWLCWPKAHNTERHVRPFPWGASCAGPASTVIGDISWGSLWGSQCPQLGGIACYAECTENVQCRERVPSKRAGMLKILQTIGGVSMRSQDLTRRKEMYLKSMDNANSNLWKQLTRFLLSVLILLTSLTVVSCTSSVPQELTAKERLWKDQGVRDYDFTLVRQAFAPEDWRGPVNIQVRNGTAVSVTYVSSGVAVTEGKFDNADTIDDLFTILKNAYTGNGEFEQFGKKADTINVTYNTQMGYPTDFYIDVSQTIADEEQGYTITNLVVQSTIK